MYYLYLYKLSDSQIWDAFVRSSRNATFLFERAYMDYHADRFCDVSLLVYDEKQHLCALFPATWHQEEMEIRSHGGLTYGGLLLNKSVGVLESCDILLEIVKFYRDNFQAQRMLVNPVPSIYHETAAEYQLFALHYIEAQLFRRYISTSVALDRKIELSTNRKRQIKKALQHGFSVKQNSDNLILFWNLLADTLLERHDARPVHTYQELELLTTRFPRNISLHTVEDSQGNLVGGTLLFHTRRVIHAQYIAASPIGRKYGALDLLFSTLFEELQGIPSSVRPRFFDFGTSMEGEGTVINEGLVAQKESFGGHTICYDKYIVQLS